MEHHQRDTLIEDSLTSGHLQSHTGCHRRKIPIAGGESPSSMPAGPSLAARYSDQYFSEAQCWESLVSLPFSLLRAASGQVLPEKMKVCVMPRTKGGGEDERGLHDRLDMERGPPLEPCADCVLELPTHSCPCPGNRAGAQGHPCSVWIPFEKCFFAPK